MPEGGEEAMRVGERDEVLARLRALRERFREVHRLGMEYLKRGDYEGMGDAVKIEREIIDEQQRLIARMQRSSN